MPAGVREPFWAEWDRSCATARARASRRRDRVVGTIGYCAAAAAPPLLWHEVVADIAAEFRLNVAYLVAEWTPWVLLAAALCFLAPVAWSAGRNPAGRWYPRARNAYAAWGITLYLLGTALAVQVAQIHAGSS